LVQELYKKILEFRGHSIIGQANDGEECLNKLIDEDINPDFIIMEYQMPKMNGLEVTKKLMKEKPDSKIIFLSDDISVKNEALNCGAVSFVKKPFSLNSLYNCIDDVIDRNKSP
jgi:DNA-binding NarL/FixJ family response regulator